jgi:four helix bundle protein
MHERQPRDFRSLQVWQRAHRLVLAVYRVIDDFPSEERHDLARQIRRCSVSIPANIAEGCGRGGGTELARFMEIARGSASELEYFLILSRDLGMLMERRFAELSAELDEVQRMLTSYRARVLAEEPATAYRAGLTSEDL